MVHACGIGYVDDRPKMMKIMKDLETREVVQLIANPKEKWKFKSCAWGFSDVVSDHRRHI